MNGLGGLGGAANGRWRRLGQRWNNNYYGNASRRRNSQIPYSYYSLLSFLLPTQG